jgi:hypothetical protein
LSYLRRVSLQPPWPRRLRCASGFLLSHVLRNRALGFYALSWRLSLSLTRSRPTFYCLIPSLAFHFKLTASGAASRRVSRSWNQQISGSSEFAVGLESTRWRRKWTECSGRDFPRGRAQNSLELHVSRGFFWWLQQRFHFRRPKITRFSRLETAHRQRPDPNPHETQCRVTDRCRHLANLPVSSFT